MTIDWHHLPSQVFVTGTDTEVGKTYCTALMVKHLQQLGIETFPFKPISAGVDPNPEDKSQFVNLDAYELYQAAQKRFSLAQINPIVLQQPIAPHIAARQEQVKLNAEVLSENLQHIPNAQVTLVEGAGGWLLPLNDTELMSDWVAEHKMPVILVVGVKLGCLNHAMLTMQSIINSGVECLGWVANFYQGETDVGRENVSYLSQQFQRLYQVPLLFEVQKGQQQLAF